MLQGQNISSFLVLLKILYFSCGSSIRAAVLQEIKKK
jgi:hypothetical protein